MPIFVRDNCFVLETPHTHYAFGVADGELQHIHWGEKCPRLDYTVPNYREEVSQHPASEFDKREYVPFGGTNYRECALKCTFSDGCRDTVLQYDSYTLKDNTLTVICKDRHYPLTVKLIYQVQEDSDVLTRSAEIVNTGNSDITLHKAASAQLHLPSRAPYTVLNFNGSWSAEFRKAEEVLKGGSVVFESRRGLTGHCQNPSVVFSQNATEDEGDVFFAALGFSGNFKISAERNFTGLTHAVIGLQDFDFSYTLHASESFKTPPVYMGFTKGFAAMSHEMHRFAVEHILPKRFKNEPLPVLYNSWEATEFDVNEKDQLRLAKIAASLGCELFVMDDGWFGERKDDHAGLGDWFVNREKFPNGLKPLIDGVRALGMKFGIWVEPEMVSPDSDLFRKHPDWAYHYPTRKGNELRWQLVLNFTRQDVQDYIFTCLDELLTENDISYIKWDMNRPFSETGAENLENPQELWYRHTLALYSVVDRLRAKHPDVQFEACASGGGRVDFGAMHHFDMVWTSDNTDPVDRLVIQNGYSYLYPIKCMRAWVTDMNRTSRPTSLDYRFNVSMQGSLSLGGNLLEYTDEELKTCAKYIALYKELRPLVQFGKLYRLTNGRADRISMTQYVDKNRENSVLFVCTQPTTFFADRFVTIRLKGLCPDAMYRVQSSGEEFTASGGVLMHCGFHAKFTHAFASEIYRIKKLPEAQG